MPRPRLIASRHLGILPLVCLTALVGSVAGGASAATITWDGGGGNLNWLTPANWSGDVLPGPADDVIIDVAGDVTITLAGNASVLSLTSNEGLTINSGGSLTVAGTASNAGLVTLANGRLIGGAWTVPAGLTASGATAGNRLDGLSLTGSVAVTTNNWLALRNGLTLNGTIALSGTNPRLIVETSMTIAGNATIQLDGGTFNPARLNIDGTSVLTTAPSVTIEGGWAEIGNAVSTGGVSGFVNGGTLRCDTNGANFTINGEQFTNSGTTEATAGTLFVAPSQSSVNTGLIRALTGGVVELSGPTLADDLGDVRNVSGTIRMKSSLDLNGGTLLFDAITGVWLLDGAVISDGTVSVTPGFSPTFGTSTNTVFDATTLNGTIGIGAGQRLWLRNGLTLNGSITMTGANPRLVIDGTQTITGNGTINLDGSGFNPARINIEGTSVLTTAPTITIEGGWAEIGNAIATGGVSGFINGGLLRCDTVGANFSVNGEQFTNNGTVEVTAGTLIIDLAQPWTNTGTMTAFPTGTLRLNGQTTLASYAGILNAGGTVLNTTTLDLAGQTFVLSPSQGIITFDGATLKNGTLTVQPGATTDFTVSGTLFEAMSINGTLSLSSGDRLTLRNGLVLNGSITMTGANPRLVIDGTQTISGNGTINLDGNAFNPARINIEGTSVLTTASTITIEGGWAEIGNAFTSNGVSGFVNSGVLRADTAGASFQIVGEQFTNTGTTEVTAGVLTLTPTQSLANSGLLRALTGGDLSIDGPITFATLGDLRNVSGIVRLKSPLALGGNTLNLNATTGIWTLDGTIISNGSILAAAGSAPVFTGQNTVFDGMTVLSPLVVGSNQRLWLRNGLVLNNTLTLNGTNPRLIIDGTQTISGNGTINLDGGAFNPARVNIESTSVLTTASTITIEGGWAEIGNAVATGGVSGFVNGGSLRADTPGASFAILGEQFTNTGTTEVTAGVLNLAPTQSIINTGLLRALTGGDLTVDGPITLANLGDLRNVSGIVRLKSSLALGGNTLNLNATTGVWTLDGTTISNGSILAAPGAAPLFTGQNTVFDGMTVLSPLVVGSNQRLWLRNGLVLNSPLTLNGTNPRLIVDGTQTISGNGTINLDGGAFNPARVNLEGTSVLTTAATITIEGGWAEIGNAISTAGVSGFVNNGVLRADTANGTFDINPSAGDLFTNNGTVETLNGNTLVIHSATNLSGAGTLTGGVWKANNATLRFGNATAGLPVRTLNGTEVILTGRNGKVLDLAKLEAITTTGILRLFEGAVLTATPAGGTLVDEGFLFVSGTSKLVVNGGFTHTPTAVLTVATGAAGQIIVDASGLLTLTGVVQVSNGPGYTPVAGDQIVLADGSARIGQFSTITTCEASDLFYTPTQAVYVYGEDTGIFGDLNGDGFVGPADLALLLGSWGACSDLCCQADLDLSGDVGPADIALLLGSWG